MSEISTQPLTPEIMDEMSLADLESALAEGRITTKALAKAMMDRMFFLKVRDLMSKVSSIGPVKLEILKLGWFMWKI